MLGWAIEWLQAFFLIADDIMDASPTRRGAPCWYKLPSVAMIAINDAFLLQSQMFRMIKRAFGGDAALYAHLLELFIDTTWRTELGQGLDLTSAPLGGAVDLTRFTLARYRQIVLHKTAYYSFHLPVCCGLALAGLTAEAAAPRVAAILLLMGEYFQVQDDFLDAFADAAVLGKVGTDIQDNKCSWLVVTALSVATPAQRARLEAAYGRHDDASVADVKALYAELGLPALYAEYERETVAKLQALIASAASAEAAAAHGERAIPAVVFTALLDKIYKREK